MRTIAFLSLFPSLIDQYQSLGVFRIAAKKKLARFKNINLRDHAIDRHGSVDASPYGGGDGMVLRPEPLEKAIQALDLENKLVVFPSPQGQRWSDLEARKLAQDDRDLVMVCGRFAGIDQRFLDQYVDREYSLGDYILSGGELAALVMVDSLLRFIPGVLGHPDSAEQDSFSKSFAGGLEYPLYTKPLVFNGQEVPPILRSGDHAAIEEWRKNQSLAVTKHKRPDLLDQT